MPVATLYVLAGVNGSGKSSLLGTVIRNRGIDYFNPDEWTGKILAKNPTITLPIANSQAWHLGKEKLQRSISDKLNYAFETTLGGNTIACLLRKAHEEGLKVRIWYVGLKSVELNIERVRMRVAKGGHDIPEQKIRERYRDSMLNLIKLTPYIDELRLVDNSAPAVKNKKGQLIPSPVTIAEYKTGELKLCHSTVPKWAKSVIAAIKTRIP